MCDHDDVVVVGRNQRLVRGIPNGASEKDTGSSLLASRLIPGPRVPPGG